MVYKCIKCEFFFQRKNEPSKCPSCENQYVIGANSKEREDFVQKHGKNKTESVAKQKLGLHSYWKLDHYPKQEKYRHFQRAIANRFAVLQQPFVEG